MGRFPERERERETERREHRGPRASAKEERQRPLVSRRKRRLHPQPSVHVALQKQITAFFFFVKYDSNFPKRKPLFFLQKHTPCAFNLNDIFVNGAIPLRAASKRGDSSASMW